MMDNLSYLYGRMTDVDYILDRLTGYRIQFSDDEYKRLAKIQDEFADLKGDIAYRLLYDKDQFAVIPERENKTSRDRQIELHKELDKICNEFKVEYIFAIPPQLPGFSVTPKLTQFLDECLNEYVALNAKDIVTDADIEYILNKHKSTLDLLAKDDGPLTPEQLEKLRYAEEKHKEALKRVSE